MKLTLQLQLLPDTQQADALRATMERFNAAADWLAGLAFEARIASKFELQKRHYADLRQRFGLSAQMTIRCIAQVCEAYKRDKTKRPRFRRHAAVPYDQRIMSFKGIDRVSLLTLSGRILVPYLAGQYQRERFGFAKGQADLVLRRDGKWFLLVTVDLPDSAPIPTTDFIGVDLGVTNIAATSDGQTFSGQAIENVRQKHFRVRRSLGRKMKQDRYGRRTRKNARRAMRRIGSREQRFRRDVNHVISKQLVAQAKDTRRGIALEELKGIRQRTRFGRKQRAKMAGWSFHQLRQFIAYKATLAGIPVVAVDPRNTSRTCNQCGHCEKANRPSQDRFECRRCGHTAHADLNAARNIRDGAAVNRPEVSERQQHAA